jgi:hypothetical protein
VTKISSSSELIKAIDVRKEALRKKDVELRKRAGLSSAALPLIRKRGGNMNTDTMFALAKVLGLTITIQTNQEARAAQNNPTTVNQHPLVLRAASARPQPYITDIKIIDLETSWGLSIKKSGSDDWVSVRIEQGARRD